MKHAHHRPSPSQRLYQVVYRARWRFPTGFRPPTPVLRRTRAGPEQSKFAVKYEDRDS